MGCRARTHHEEPTVSGGYSLAAAVQDLLERLTSDRLDVGFKTSFVRGSAQGTVTVVAPSGKASNPLLVVTFDIMRSPSANPGAFCQRLLELNSELKGRAAFCLVDDGLVCLQAGRPLEDLDAGELIDLIVWTAGKADDYDDVLLDEFGRELAL